MFKTFQSLQATTTEGIRTDLSFPFKKYQMRLASNLRPLIYDFHIIFNAYILGG